MTALRDLKPVVARPGRPLYLAVKDAIRSAIDAGIFRPDEQLPSTKQLSEQLEVSLVTAHRALQELMSAGVLRRAQGKGTFVNQRYLEQNKTCCEFCVGVAFHRDASLSDFYHGQLLDGFRRAAQSMQIDLILLRFCDAVREQCDGYLYINPSQSELEKLSAAANSREPALVVGARSHLKNINYVDVDNVDLAKQAIAHLVSLGHRRIGYIGPSDDSTHSQDRWTGFQDACREHRLAVNPEHIFRAPGMRLEANQLDALSRMLGSAQRPTAIFAAGFYYALQLYGLVARHGLRIPQELSLIGVDNPPSANHLWPPLTTMRQPLIELGQVAMTALGKRISTGSALDNWRLPPELTIRESTAPPSESSAKSKNTRKPSRG